MNGKNREFEFEGEVHTFQLSPACKEFFRNMKVDEDGNVEVDFDTEKLVHSVDGIEHDDVEVGLQLAASFAAIDFLAGLAGLIKTPIPGLNMKST